MKYYLYVTAIDGDSDRDGEYDGVDYESLDEAKHALTIAEQDETLDIVIKQRGE